MRTSDCAESSDSSDVFEPCVSLMQHTDTARAFYTVLRGDPGNRAQTLWSAQTTRGAQPMRSLTHNLLRHPAMRVGFLLVITVGAAIIGRAMLAYLDEGD